MWLVLFVFITVRSMVVVVGVVVLFVFITVRSIVVVVSVVGIVCIYYC